MRSLALSTVGEFQKERTRLGPKSDFFFGVRNWMCGVRACGNMQKRVSHGETVRVGSSVIRSYDPVMVCVFSVILACYMCMCRIGCLLRLISVKGSILLDTLHVPSLILSFHLSKYRQVVTKDISVCLYAPLYFIGDLHYVVIDTKETRVAEVSRSSDASQRLDFTTVIWTC